MSGQPKGWMYKRSYLKIETHYQGFRGKNDAIETYSCNLLDISTNCGVLLLGEGIYRLCLHCNHFDFMGQSNSKWLAYFCHPLYFASKLGQKFVHF